MKTPTIEAAWIPNRSEPTPLRLRADSPARLRSSSGAARHDFLVPILWPEFDTGNEPRPEHTDHRRFPDPDSMFWSPTLHGGDAA
jgi:hypothetical protein